MLDRDGALQLLEDIERSLRKQGDVPEDFLEMKEGVEEAVRHAKQFMACLRVVDWGMVNGALTLMKHFVAVASEWRANHSHSVH